jgi:hypothetical protein
MDADPLIHKKLITGDLQAAGTPTGGKLHKYKNTPISS